ncbi:MAG TPA: hypothetical protein VEV18_08170 [Steroidobacteraceae bacterium]|nr:hypothetical protein [Steroidobacteraceae bacterium]
MRLLGCDFEFEVRGRALDRLVQYAFAGLPSHALAADVPLLKLSLMIAPLARRRARGGAGAPSIETMSASGLLCGSTERSTFVAISPGDRSALIVVARDMLRNAYHVRYELIEFAVYTLAARARGLVPLHAACIGREGRGLLVMGDTGAGKSTAALHCALRGLDLVAEDSTFVAPESMLGTGVANFLHVRREALRYLPARVGARMQRFPVIRRRSGVAKLEIDLRRAALPLAPSPVRLAGTVFAVARRAARGAPLLVALGADDALARLAAAQPYAAHRPEWPTFAHRVSEQPAFELRRGSHPDETAAALESLLAATPVGAAMSASV